MFDHIKRGQVTIGGKTFTVRSEWEANYACYLEFLFLRAEIKDWLYEPHTFWFEGIKRGTNSYKPDFKVIRNNGTHYWVEVKGYKTAKDNTKIKRMKKYFPDEELVLVDKKKYMELAANKFLFKGWGSFSNVLKAKKPMKGWLK